MWMLVVLMSGPALADDGFTPARPRTRRDSTESEFGDDISVPSGTRTVDADDNLFFPPEAAWTGSAFFHDDSAPDVISTPADASDAERPETWESQLTAFEERLDELDEKDTELEESITALEGDRVRVGTSNASMRINGRIHADYWAFPGDDAGVIAFEGMNPQDRFIFRRVRVGVSGDIGENMEYRMDIEFATAIDPAFKDVYLGFNNLPFLQTVLIGNQKRPYGLDHINSTRYNVFMERPFIVEALNQDSRRLGIQSWGMSDDLRYNWRYGVFTLQDTQLLPGHVSDHYGLEVAGRLAHTLYDEYCDGENYWHFAIAGAAAHPDATGGPLSFNEARFQTRPEARTNLRWLNTGRIDGAQWYEILGLETVYNEGPLQLCGEVQGCWVQRDDFDNVGFWGAYGYVGYFLTGEHIPWDRETGQLDRMKPRKNFFFVDDGCRFRQEGWGAWQVAARYSYADFSNEDILGGVGHSMTLGLNWHWNPNARVQFNYLRGWIDDHAPVAGRTAGDYHIIGMRGMVDF
jgi:phosphate-selective porin OprO/OprP